MIRCPNCMHQEMVGAIFCSECGAQLIVAEGVVTSTIRTTSDFPSTESTARDLAQDELGSPDSLTAESKITLNILSDGKTIELEKTPKVILGRITKDQITKPDIGLSPHEAYKLGVSRLHASIQVHENSISVTDLGSVNGTRVNGRKITSHIPYPINNGDILTLGKFKIQVTFQNE